MIERYPHIAKIEVSTEIDNGGGFPEIVKETFEIKGRYEPNPGNKNLDYSAKFFSRKLDVLSDDPKALDGMRMLINGSWIGISQAWNYQIHAEIWLD